MPNFWIPVRPLSKGLAAEMRIGGMATLDGVLDLDQQLMASTGVISSLDYLTKFGKVNWNHGDRPGDLIGDIDVAEIRDDDRPEYSGQTGLYIEALLNPAVPAAKEAFRFMKGGGRLGFSVQGVTLKLKKATHDGFPAEKIETSFVSQVALTPEPKNYGTFAEVLKSLRAGPMKKGLTAGAGSDSSQFTGGRSLVRESFGPPSNSDHLIQLARSFRAHHGPVPRDAGELRKALQTFCKTMCLRPDQSRALADYLTRRKPQ